MSARVQFLTWEYERSHGTRPNGRGWWAFLPCDAHGPARNAEPVFVNEWVTLTEAKRRVREISPDVRVWEVAP